jgi:hypothetical protein
MLLLHTPLYILPSMYRHSCTRRVLAEVRSKDGSARSQRFLSKDTHSRIHTKDSTSLAALQASIGGTSSKRDEFCLNDLCVRHRYSDSLVVDATGEQLAQQYPSLRTPRLSST